MTVIAWEAMRSWAGEGFHLGRMMLMTWLVVQGGGAVVEIAELIGLPMGDVNVGGYLNNALDLVANALGGALALPLVVWYDRRRDGRLHGLQLRPVSGTLPPSH